MYVPRDADKLIEQGKVQSTVRWRNGTTGGRNGHRAGGKKILQGKQTQKVLAFYKPVGVTCTREILMQRKRSWI
ncbi:MAG: hypothetical protein ACLR79_05350 [Waltera sp.]